MKRIIFVGLAILALPASRALAADMPIGAPAVIAYNWTGFYAGATVGGIGANFDPRTSTGPADYLNLVEAVSVTSSGTQTINPRSFTGGFEAGYNW